MSTTDDLLKNNESFAQSFDKGDLPLPPAKKIAIVACMDARLNPYPILGLELGDAHVIRNDGGVITDDEIRSLAISQHLLGTEEIMLIHHTDCGMLTFNDREFADKLEAETARSPPPQGWRRYVKWAVGLLAAFAVLGAIGSNLVNEIVPDVKEKIVSRWNFGIAAFWRRLERFRHKPGKGNQVPRTRQLHAAARAPSSTRS
jgi:hypothetical protein